MLFLFTNIPGFSRVYCEVCLVMQLVLLAYVHSTCKNKADLKVYIIYRPGLSDAPAHLNSNFFPGALPCNSIVKTFGFHLEKMIHYLRYAHEALNVS